MTLTKLAKWSSVVLLVGVVVIVAWSYVRAHEHDQLPAHHPWPALSLLAGALMSILIGSGKASRTAAIARLVVVALFATSALIYMTTLV